MEFTKYKDKGDYHWKEYELKTTYGKYADTIRPWIKEKLILDIGAGDGLITSLLGAYGVDDNQEAVDLANMHGIPVKLGSAYQIPFDDDLFDAVFMGDVLEHLEFPQKALIEAHRVLKKGGMIYITTPPAREDRVVQEKFHYREYTQEEFIAELKEAGFDLVEPITTNFQRMYGKFKKS